MWVALAVALAFFAAPTFAQSTYFYQDHDVFVGSYTVSALPAAGIAGRRAIVTDQVTSCPQNGSSAFTGGGSVKCPAFDNGAAWAAE